MKINEIYRKPAYPERVIQFGEGGFLRGFVDWMLQRMNSAKLFSGSAVIVQPIEQGLCGKLSEQDCIYTHVMRGLENGKPTVQNEVITSVSRCVEPYRDFDSFLKLAEQPEFRFIVSNTTESGIAYHAGDRPDDRPPASYPAKLTCLLYRRYLAGLDGFIILPCELIDKNGQKLKEIVLRYAEEWALDAGFIQWLNEKNIFCCTLVDRIVTGRLTEDLGLPYEDACANTSELFHLWVIEGPKCIEEELPLRKAGLNVIFTDDLENYRTRKVRILNGAHTSLVAYAMLRGFETVGECVADPKMRAYLEACVYDEILPTLDLPANELRDYADSVFERFANPYLSHRLSSIALNSVSKFKVRVLPSILTYQKRFGHWPKALLRGFSALLAFYQTDMANDAEDVLSYMKTHSTAEILANSELWGEDLSELYEELMRIADSSV